MKRFILIGGLLALGAIVAMPAYSREIRDPEAKFKIKVPDNWSAMSQSSRDGSSFFWAFLSPRENFRVLLRTNKLSGRFECAKLLGEFESNELKARMPDFKRMPLEDDDDSKTKEADECGGAYTGLRKDGKSDRRAYVVIVNFAQKGGVVFRWLGEGQTDEFSKRAGEFMAVWESIELLD